MILPMAIPSAMTIELKSISADRRVDATTGDQSAGVVVDEIVARQQRHRRRTRPCWVTVEATKAIQIGKNTISDADIIRPAWVSQVPMPRFSTMPLGLRVSSAPGVQ
jgi:hypothetical protein